MAVSLIATRWQQAFTEARTPNQFMSRMFTIKPGGIYNGGKVAIDISRMGEDVAIVVKKCTGPNLNDIDVFTTKEFTPPAYGEAVPFDVCDLINRMIGVDPFSAANMPYSAQLTAYFVRGFAAIDNKIKRGVELQASQILQTGKLILLDANGDMAYELNFMPKASHFPTVATSWPAVGATPLQDLEALAKQIRADSGINPNRLLMGEAALFNFLANEDVQKRLDNRRMEVGEFAPHFEDSGATFQGFVWVGNYKFEMWSYPETYKDPQSGLPVEYLAPDKVVMLSTRTRLDMTSARVPLPIAPDPRVAGLLPGRISDRSNGFDVTPNVYASLNGKTITGELESRTLLIPVQIDGFGCLDTEI